LWFPRVKGVNAKVGDFWATQIQWKLMEDAALDKVLNLQFLSFYSRRQGIVLA